MAGPLIRPWARGTPRDKAAASRRLPMDVIFLSPGYPAEMAHYTRGLAEVGARVWGVGDSHPQALPEHARKALAGYLQVPRIMDEQDVIARVREWTKNR